MTSERKQAALQKQHSLPSPLWLAARPSPVRDLGLFIICNTLSRSASDVCSIGIFTLPKALCFAKFLFLFFLFSFYNFNNNLITFVIFQHQVRPHSSYPPPPPSFHCTAISAHPGWKYVFWKISRQPLQFAQHLTSPGSYLHFILFFLDGSKALLAFFFRRLSPRTCSDIRHMFFFCFCCTFQWWLLPLRFCSLATKHQPAPGVLVGGYDGVGRDQHVAESGTTVHERHAGPGNTICLLHCGVPSFFLLSIFFYSLRRHLLPY